MMHLTDSSVMKRSNITRPRSTPPRRVDRYPESISLPLRPQTAVEDEVSGCDECDRLKQVTSRESVRRQTLNPTLPIKKSRQETPRTAWEWSDQHLEEGKSALYCKVGPGYVIRRTRSKIGITIDSDQFFGPRLKKRETATRQSEDMYRDSLIHQLQQQVSDLQLFLEEGRLNHREAVEKYENLLKTTETQLENKRIQEVSALKAAHEQLISELQLKFDNEAAAARVDFEDIRRCMQQDIDTLEASFDVYKTSIASEWEEKLNQQAADLKKCFDEENEAALQELAKRLEQEHEDHIADISAEHNREIDDLKWQHKEQMEGLVHRQTNANDAEGKLKRVLEEFRALQKQHESLKDENANIKEIHKSVQNELAATKHQTDQAKSELKEFADRFEERVRLVDEQYRDQIARLQKEAVELRRAYMRKCEELVDEKARGEVELKQRVENAKDVMRHVIVSRERAHLSLFELSVADTQEITQTVQGRRAGPSAGLTSSLKECRPTSAPSTQTETGLAKLAISNRKN